MPDAAIVVLALRTAEFPPLGADRSYWPTFLDLPGEVCSTYLPITFQIPTTCAWLSLRPARESSAFDWRSKTSRRESIDNYTRYSWLTYI
ncbi:hypothetical protein E2P81_ATG06331 [Venturia nashicola]|uniref:Uncharacterized protein n=1 Tax=Venturia nashicola TaxID=86259 RepID=A0A4Z1NQT7_9PEZI|nr:hypothetical protein E6O75_ATG06483 [Venturia nashicola]TLD27985.1 hypothetical protein E2P81_ATG06331 [Venturia nashicola]